MRENKNFIKLTQKKGISLIVLIVTIIVIIILAAVVILTITKNNPIENAKEATFKEDVRTFQDDLALFISKEYTDSQGQRDEKISSLGEDVKKYISSFTDKYVGKFIIENDELVFSGEDEKELDWIKELNIKYREVFNAEIWNKNATKEDCFEWEGTVIVGINADMLTDRTKLKIPCKCTEINPKYVSTYESYRSFMPELQEIEIPETVTTIGDYAFHNAGGIKSIVIPDSVTSIGANAFSYCSNLISIIIPDSVTSIGNSTFRGCSNLTSIIIPNSLTSIGGETFRSCQNLTSVTIPNSVKTIGWGTFYYDRNLKSITFKGTIEEWNNINKDSEWKAYSSIQTITCTDGVITL